MKSALIIAIAYFLFPQWSFSQCQNIGFPAICTTAVHVGICSTWANGCGGGWTRSHGTPELKPYTVLVHPPTSTTAYYAYMWSAILAGPITRSEGMFAPYPFIANQTVQITVRASTSLSSGTGTGGVANFYATKGLTQGALVECGDAIPAIPASQKQLIGQITGINNTLTDFTFTFTPSAGSSWTEIWMYPEANSSNQYNLSVFNIQICSSCSQTIVFNSGTVPSGQTTAAVISAGSSAGTGGSGTVTVASSQATSLIATTEVNLLQSFQATVTGTGSFSALINPCGYVPPMTTSDINFDSVNVATPPTLEVSSSQNLTGIIGSASSIFDLDVDNDPNRKLLIYPSISAGIVNISGSPLALTNSDLLIFDELGRTVYRMHNANSTTITMDLSNLRNGVYFLQIRSQSKPSVTKKFFISK
jgi:hypothetical protein